MILKGIYTSSWDEGDIVTGCAISLPSCDIVNTEISDEGDDFEHHNGDSIQVEINGEFLELEVEDDAIIDEDKKFLLSKAKEFLSALK